MRTKRVLLSVLLLLTFLIPTAIFAVENDPLKGQVTSGLSDAGEAIGVDTDEKLPAIVGNVIRQLLTLVGVVVVVIIIYAGFMWMTAGGDTEKIKKAKAWLTNSIIGLVIVFAAYAIADFVINAILSGTGVE